MDYLIFLGHMNKKYFLWCVISILFICTIILAFYLNTNSGISSKPNVKTTKNFNKSFDDDTLVNISIKGKKFEFKIKKANISELFEIKKFIKDNFMKDNSNKLEYKSDTLIEITGEGILNKCKIWIRMSGSDVLLTHQIIQNDTIIWNDSLVVDDEILKYGDVMDDSLYIYI